MIKKILYLISFVSLILFIKSPLSASLQTETVLLPQEKNIPSAALKSLARPLFPLMKNPEHNAEKTVRFFGSTPALSNEELAYLHERDEITSKAQSLFLDTTISPEETIRIAIVGSGGGDTAALYLIHFLKELSSLGIFPNTIHYLAGISGSTFTIGALYASEKEIDSFFEQMQKGTQTGFLTNPVVKTFTNLLPLIKVVTECSIQRLLAGLPPTGVDPYGVLLLEHYMGNQARKDYLKKTLSTQLRAMDLHNYPLPIYVAATPINAAKECHLIEMTPLRVTHFGAQADIPATSFNWPIGGIMGVCGSALSTPARLTIPALIDRLKPQALFKPIKRLFTETELGTISLFPTYFHNFAKKLPESPYFKKNLLLIVDAGITINIPFIPFLLQAERDIDLFIAIDAGGDVWWSSVLSQTEEYCKKLALPFPKVRRCNAPLATFFDDGPSSNAPAVLYFPISSGNYDALMKHDLVNGIAFKRTPESLALFASKAKEQITQALPQLKKTMLSLIERKRARKGALKRKPHPFTETSSSIF